MSTQDQSQIEVAEEQRTPLLPNHDCSSVLVDHTNSTAPRQNEDTILPLADKAIIPNQRLASLDVFRGLTVALMILVDDVGGAFPSLNHSPWFGVTLADFVMPFFLFGVGVSIGLVFKKVSSKPNATKKVILRTIKLFLLGLLLQGGYFHGRDHLTYGVDLSKIRWLGVLQRISIGYFLASMSEIWLVNNNILVDSPVAFVRKYSVQWMFSVLLCLVYLCLLYGLYVPNWKFEYSKLLWSGQVSVTQNVHCEVRGSLDPPCNAVGFIDRLILGEHHLYQRPVYRRTKECSVNSPDYGPLPPDSPGWCLAPFDPEGILSSLMAAITCSVGLQFGHILALLQGHKQRVLLWSVSSFCLLLVGYILEILGIPLSKALYTLSYMCITAGASGLVLTAIYYIGLLDTLRCHREFLWLSNWPFEMKIKYCHRGSKSAKTPQMPSVIFFLDSPQWQWHYDPVLDSLRSFSTSVFAAEFDLGVPYDGVPLYMAHPAVFVASPAPLVPPLGDDPSSSSSSDSDPPAGPDAPAGGNAIPPMANGFL